MNRPTWRWDHNRHYHPLLLRQLPANPGTVLDVGCGTGVFATRLAERAGQVDALDRSAAMIETARRRVPANVSCLLDDVLTRPLPAGHYDAVTSISALHQLPLPVLLPRLAAALRPGGVLAAIALPRADLPRELVQEGFSVLANMTVGLTLARDDPRRLAADPAMPVREPQLTIRQVRAQATAALAGARVSRLVFWRYLLVWRKP